MTLGSSLQLWEKLIQIPEGVAAAQDLVDNDWSYWQNLVPTYWDYLNALAKLRVMLKKNDIS